MFNKEQRIIPKDDHPDLKQPTLLKEMRVPYLSPTWSAIEWTFNKCSWDKSMKERNKGQMGENWKCTL